MTIATFLEASELLGSRSPSTLYKLKKEGQLDGLFSRDSRVRPSRYEARRKAKIKGLSRLNSAMEN